MADGPELLLKPTHGLSEERRGFLRESATLLVQLRAQPAMRASSARQAGSTSSARLTGDASFQVVSILESFPRRILAEAWTSTAPMPENQSGSNFQDDPELVNYLDHS